jgi:hypothetical protein
MVARKKPAAKWPASKAKSAKAPASNTVTTANSVRVRMYRHGLGDCFLLRFPREDGTGDFKVLIDCGLITVASDPKTKMGKVVANIAIECQNELDLVIMTHEHWDHASGFSKEQVQAQFDKIGIGEVWYAWTEDPDNALGKKLRKERAAKLKGLQLAAHALRIGNTPLGIQRAQRVERLLQFFGIGSPADLAAARATKGPGKSELAFKYLEKRSDVKTRYCYPDKPPIQLKGVDGVHVYFLGPPQDEGLIKRSAPTKKGAEVYEFAADLGMDENLAAAFERLAEPTKDAGAADHPFEAGFAVYPVKQPNLRLRTLMQQTWDNPGMEWRRIEDDWTSSAERLALNLDNHTNNTCLVVAFELVKTGRVLLFAADAQVGNWLSWQNTRWTVKDADGSTRAVTGPGLLQRTVFYKVGHHGSHNATLRSLGLEQMTSDDLVAFIPVFKEQAEANRWHEIPFKPLVKRLKEKTGGRLVMSDEKLKAPVAGDLSALSMKDTDTFLKGLTVDKEFYEYSFPI